MMGLMSFLWRARRAVRANFHFGLNDFARESFGVRISARARARKADIHGVDSERLHQVKDFDFLGDARIVDRRILKAVAKGFVIQHYAAAGGDFGAGECVPVVDEFAFHFFRARL